MRTIWDDLYDEEWLATLNAKLRDAQKLADRQAFGMVRKENTVAFVNTLTSVKTEIESILKRVK